MKYDEHRTLIDRVAAENGVSSDLVMSLLNLEATHANLHGWGARPALRREITQIIDAHLKATAG